LFSFQKRVSLQKNRMEDQMLFGLSDPESYTVDQTGSYLTLNLVNAVFFLMRVDTTVTNMRTNATYSYPNNGGGTDISTDSLQNEYLQIQMNIFNMDFEGNITGFGGSVTVFYVPDSYLTWNASYSSITNAINISWAFQYVVPDAITVSVSNDIVLNDISTNTTSYSYTNVSPGQTYDCTFVSRFGSQNIPYTISIYIPAAPVACFLQDAPILTPTGYRKISTLKAGEYVLTSDNRPVPIQRVLRSRVASGPTTNPYIIPKGLYGATERVFVSPNHCIAVDGAMKEARTLQLAMEHTMPKEFDYYNLELPCWKTDTMVVAGVTVESFANVRRIRMTVEAFRKKIVQQYGKITPELLHKIQATCRCIENTVDVPVVTKSLHIRY